MYTASKSHEPIDVRHSGSNPRRKFYKTVKLVINTNRFSRNRQIIDSPRPSPYDSDEDMFRHRAANWATPIVVSPYSSDDEVLDSDSPSSQDNVSILARYQKWLRKQERTGYTHWEVLGLVDDLKMCLGETNNTDVRAKIRTFPYQDYYRFFDAFHPQHLSSSAPLPPGTNDSHPPLPRGNVKIDFDLSMKQPPSPHSLEIPAIIYIKASWIPMLQEFRSSTAEYPPFLSGQEPPHEQIQSLQNRLFLAFTSSLPAFWGPSLYIDILTATNHQRDKIPGFGQIQALYDPLGLIRLTGRCGVTTKLIAEGNLRLFPFDEREVNFHISSGHPQSDIRFSEIESGTEKRIFERAKTLSEGQEWSVRHERDVKVVLRYRNVRSTDDDEDWKCLDEVDETRRSKICVTITLHRDAYHWFWKIIFPIDIITAVGFCAFLFAPLMTNAPTPEQRIGISTYLVTVLLAQAAFVISVRPLVPSTSHMTLLDLHISFCLLLTGLQTIALTATRTSDWKQLSKPSVCYSIFVAALALLVLEQVVAVLCIPAWKKTIKDREGRQQFVEPFDIQIKNEVAAA